MEIVGVSNQSEIHKHIRGRDMISDMALGISDGVITNLAFLVGLAGALSSIPVIRLAGLASMFAGSISMFFGGLLKARSELELFRADLKRESYEIEHEPEEEKRELRELYMEKGLTEQEADMVVKRISKNKEQWLKDILMHELHLHQSQVRNPFRVAGVIGFGFMVGALVPLVPYLLLASKGQSIILSVILSLLFTFFLGAWKGKIVGRAWSSAVETSLVAALASAILYLIGSLFVYV